MHDVLTPPGTNGMPDMSGNEPGDGDHHCGRGMPGCIPQGGKPLGGFPPSCMLSGIRVRSCNIVGAVAAYKERGSSVVIGLAAGIADKVSSPNHKRRGIMHGWRGAAVDCERALGVLIVAEGPVQNIHELLHAVHFFNYLHS